jgi:hypothetical protein
MESGKMKTTREYFGKSEDELLETDPSGYTREERLIFDEGLKVALYDSIEEMNELKSEIEEDDHLEIKVILKTINERIAIVMQKRR